MQRIDRKGQKYPIKEREPQECNKGKGRNRRKAITIGEPIGDWKQRVVEEELGQLQGGMRRGLHLPAPRRYAKRVLPGVKIGTIAQLGLLEDFEE